MDRATADPLRDRWWRVLAWTFLAGAVVDVGFGVAILALQEWLAPLMRLTLPTPRVYLDLCGLLLIGLGAIYATVFRWPRRMAPIAAIATLLRFGGMALFTAAVALRRADPAFTAFALIDTTLAFAHFIALRGACGSLWGAFRE